MNEDFLLVLYLKLICISKCKSKFEIIPLSKVSICFSHIFNRFEKFKYITKNTPKGFLLKLLSVNTHNIVGHGEFLYISIID